MPQSLNHLSGPSLDSLQKLHVSLGLGSPELDMVLQRWPQQCWVKGKDPFPQPAGNTPPSLVQDTINHLRLKGTLLASVQCDVHWNPQDLFYKAAFQLVDCQHNTDAWGCSSSYTGLFTSLCWTVQHSCQLISSACQGPSEWQHDPLVYQPLIPVLCNQQTSWGYTLPHHPDC